ncbi:hypothetical protein [Aurantimonas sp. 22II-16-19i]|uniref:hypothetical protein n=1 Tax=Aurantimonas sp. 22II-16-19i TaxID=1317114 RepID=UPI0009F7DB8F|nr:hypothetical protein [Aurantimonas sp. 22II-16-19i]ORE89756.1 hypothetical protein ATO4_23797 [Aurantimonas sp. 22II-16-19i]
MTDHERFSAPNAGDWVSITEASRRLGVDRSTLSRYLDQHGDALQKRESGKSTLVDFEAVRAHRSENIRLVDEGRGRDGGKPSATPTADKRFGGSQADWAARNIAAQAQDRELNLARRKRELTPTAEVDEMGRDAIGRMRNAFDRSVESEASDLSLRYGWDERTVRSALKSFARKGLDSFHRDVLDGLDRFRREVDATAADQADGASDGPAASAGLLQ